MATTDRPGLGRSWRDSIREAREQAAFEKEIDELIEPQKEEYPPVKTANAL